MGKLVEVLIFFCYRNFSSMLDPIDDHAVQHGLIRLVDESGEDYLYPAERFVPIALPETVEKAFQQMSQP